MSRVLEGRFAFDLVVRTGDGDGWSADALGDLPVRVPAGGHVRLGDLATIERQQGPNMISREHTRRKIVVTCNVAGGDAVNESHLRRVNQR